VSVSVGLAVVSTAPALAQPHQPGSCNSHRKHAVMRTAQVIVWQKHTGTDEYGGGELFAVYACLRSGGKSIEIGQTATGGGEYEGNEAVTQLAVSGTQVSDVFSTGLAVREACSKTDPTDPECVSQSTSVAQVFELKRHHSLSLAQPLATAYGAYAFSSAGAIAWEAPINPQVSAGPLMLQAVTFTPASLARGTVQTLDSGSLGDSIQFSGLTLNWTNGGQSKSQTLSAGSAPSLAAGFARF
jgi:hypothetical protein